MQSAFPNRKQVLTRGLPLDQPGIEIAPLFSPITTKSQTRVLYVDVCSAEQSRKKHGNYEHDEILDIDVVWTPGMRLIQCIPEGLKFHWGIASHVLEHVPDPLGWLLQIFETMQDGAILSLALPLKEFCFDRFRATTSAADLIDAWLRSERVPSPRQVFDFTSRSIADGYFCVPGECPVQSRWEDCKHSYSLEDSFRFALHTWQSGEYLDAHCSVFTPDTFKPLIGQMNQLGILNAAISDPETGSNEFYVQLKRLGPPLINHPGRSFWGESSKMAHKPKTLDKRLKSRLLNWVLSQLSKVP